ncbi:MAG: dihydropteroate synthase [Pseudomonadota bacterium]|nr:dihydropteroate synthase [Pseudomonadota bacterium]
MELKFSDDTLDLDEARVMGVLNVTPDSFSDGGKYQNIDAAVDHAINMTAAGAHLIDVGGESTRPGANSICENEEIDRVVPVIEILSKELKIPISLDTSKAGVMKAGVAAGASMINDVRSLSSPGSLEAAAALDVPVCLMHMQGKPKNMQNNPSYHSLINEVLNFFEKRVSLAVAAGIPRDRLLIDPGFGFGKTLDHNLELLQNLDKFLSVELPILVGLSRKSMIGSLLENLGVKNSKPNDYQRVLGSVALSLFAANKGAHILRVHDVEETVIALGVSAAVNIPT